MVGNLAGYGSMPRRDRRATALTPEAPSSDTVSTTRRALRAMLLGGFGISVGGPLASGGTPRIQSLLAYLLLHRQTPQSRQHLAFMLWPDSTETQARANLRNLVHRVQHGLPDVWKRLELRSGAARPKIPAKAGLCAQDVGSAGA